MSCWQSWINLQAMMPLSSDNPFIYMDRNNTSEPPAEEQEPRYHCNYMGEGPGALLSLLQMLHYHLIALASQARSWCVLLRGWESFEHGSSITIQPWLFFSLDRIRCLAVFLLGFQEIWIICHLAGTLIRLEATYRTVSGNIFSIWIDQKERHRDSFIECRSGSTYSECA